MDPVSQFLAASCLNFPPPSTIAVIYTFVGLHLIIHLLFFLTGDPANQEGKMRHALHKEIGGNCSI